MPNPKRARHVKQTLLKQSSVNCKDVRQMMLNPPKRKIAVAAPSAELSSEDAERVVTCDERDGELNTCDIDIESSSDIGNNVNTIHEINVVSLVSDSDLISDLDSQNSDYLDDPPATDSDLGGKLEASSAIINIGSTIENSSDTDGDDEYDDESQEIAPANDMNDNSNTNQFQFEEVSVVPASTSSANSDANSNVAILPACWGPEQKVKFVGKYSWLVIKAGKLGCSLCGTIKNNPKYHPLIKLKRVNVSAEWSNCEIAPYGETKRALQTSLRKKMFDHCKSSAHIECQTLLEKQKEGTLDEIICEMQNEHHIVTERVFRTAYNIAKLNRPFSDLESNVQVQKLNGCDMGRILHSNVSCSNIIDHIAQEFRSKCLEEIKKSKSKFALMLDESTSLGNKSAIAIYLRVVMCDAELPINMFLDLAELNDLDADAIVKTVLDTLLKYGITNEMLETSLLALCCDGASVMLGRIRGVAEQMRQKFPNIILWHCAAHRLELSVGDTLKDITQINHFKVFIEKLHHLYHASPKNQRELRKCASSLSVELLKIGKILSTRWVASSFRTVHAVWENYPALHAHMKKASTDTNRDGKERATYSGCAKLLSSTEFLMNLGLMHDALQELSELSLELQKRNTSIIESNRGICHQIRVFEGRVEKPGQFEKAAFDAVAKLDFKGVPLHESGPNKQVAVIKRGQFYCSLVTNMRSRMLTSRASNTDRNGVAAQADSSAYDDIVKQMKVVFPTYWTEEDGPDSDVFYGETEVLALCERFQIDQRSVLRSYREYKENGGKQVPPKLRELLMCIYCVPISSAECERAFSEMNLIITSLRASLNLPRVSNLMFVKLNGPPLHLFNPKDYVRSWFAKGHHSAKDKNSLGCKIKESETEISAIWKIL